MSLKTTRKDFWQSIARSTIRERCESIFNQELLSDVKFVVRDSQGGSESKKIYIPAHKFVLAVSSPVFYAMFYGELAETKDSVEISDCEYESLLELFRFIYSDEANLTPDNVIQLMYLAKKYMVPSLADKCSAYLQGNLSATNVFAVLQDAQKYEEKDLLAHCWKVIEKETEEAVKSDGFVTIEGSVLEEMVEKDSLNIKELELFKAVDRWASNQCEKQGLVAEGSVKRRILGERIVKGIRFPLMEQKEFVDVVLDSDIRTKAESYHLMKYFNSVLNVPVAFLVVNRYGPAKAISRFKSLHKGWNYSGTVDCICLKVDKDIKLNEIRLFGSDNNRYSVTLTVKDPTGAIIVCEKRSLFSKPVRSDIGDYEGFEIVFKPPILLEALANAGYHRFEAKITGPPSWYGGGGPPYVEHSGVKFGFGISDTSFGFRSSHKCGQFAEFVYTLV